MLESNYKKSYYLSNSKIKNSTTKSREIFPNIYSTINFNSNKNINNKKYYNKIDIEPNENKKYFSKDKFQAYQKSIKINNMNFRLKKEKQSSSQPAIKLRNDYKFNIKKVNYITKIDDLELDSNNKNNDNNYFDKIKSRRNKELNYFKNNNIFIEDKLNNFDSDVNNDKKMFDHNLMISELLSKTEKFFNELGTVLDKSNKKFLIQKKDKKIKIINKGRFKDFNEHKNQNEKEEQDKKDVKKINNEIFSHERNNKNMIKFKKIIENFTKNIKNNLNKNKSFYNKSQNDINIFDNNSKRKEKNITVYYQNFKDEKMVSDKIIQTFNIPGNIQSKIKLVQSQNNILPKLSPFNNNNEIMKSKKNEIKIAEIRKVYPIYPYNRIVRLDPLYDKKYNHNIHKKILLDMKENFSHDNKYNYEQLMNKVRYGIKNKKFNIASYYRCKSNFSKNIFNNWKKCSKTNELL